MDNRLEEFLSKPFPREDLPQWLMMVEFYDKKDRDRLVMHWHETFAAEYDQLQRSNYADLDSFLRKYQGNSFVQVDALDFLYAFNDYQLCFAQGAEMADAFDGPVPFFEKESHVHATFAKLYRLCFDDGGLKAVDTLRYHASPALVQIRRLCQERMIECIEESMTYDGRGAGEWQRITEDNRSLSPLPVDILPSDMDWLGKRSVGIGLDIMEDKDQHNTHNTKVWPGLYGLLDCEEEKKEKIVGFIGSYLKGHHTGADIARLVIALRDNNGDNAEMTSESPLLTFTSFRNAYKAIVDEFPSPDLVRYNTANEAYTNIEVLWNEFKNGQDLKKGRGKTAELTYMHDMAHIRAIKNLMQRFHDILCE